MCNGGWRQVWECGWLNEKKRREVRKSAVPLYSGFVSAPISRRANRRPSFVPRNLSHSCSPGFRVLTVCPLTNVCFPVVCPGVREGGWSYKALASHRSRCTVKELQLFGARPRLNDVCVVTVLKGSSWERWRCPLPD